MQLPTVLRRMSLVELHEAYGGDISAALKKERDDKVLPAMTPLAPRSISRNSVRPARSATAFAAMSAAKNITKAAMTSLNMDSSTEPQRIDAKNLDLLSSTMLSQFMSHSTTTEGEKSAMIAALKKQLAIIEKAIPTAKHS